MLSVLGMTYSDQDRRDTLKYRLLAPSKDIGSWGHEYMRHLALEIGEEQQHRQECRGHVHARHNTGLRGRALYGGNYGASISGFLEGPT